MLLWEIWKLFCVSFHCSLKVFALGDGAHVQEVLKAQKAYIDQLLRRELQGSDKMSASAKTIIKQTFEIDEEKVEITALGV